MSITSAKSGATGISLALDNNYMEPIATTLVGSGGANTVIFNDIPQVYKHLQLRCTNKNTVSNISTGIVFNGDISANYFSHILYGDGSISGSAAHTNYPTMAFLTYNSTTANVYYSSVIDILDYNNQNKNKTVRSLNGGDYNGSGFVALSSGCWNSFAAVTSIKINVAAGLFDQYSRFSLYGIKG
jgi:hypothetical protein